MLSDAISKQNVGRLSHADMLSPLPPSLTAPSPHLLPPSQILDAHLSPALIAHRSALNAKLQTTQAQNALLHDLVLGQRAQIQALLQQLDAALDDVRGANRALLPVVGPLAREATAIASSVDAR